MSNNPNVINVNVQAAPRGPPKSRLVALILCFFFGYLGLHRFYVGKVGSGLLYLCTGGFFVIGWIFDLILIISGGFKDNVGQVV
jgi:TM2 domain-containing membrane protein YozV